jgi:hypothetical protein
MSKPSRAPTVFALAAAASLGMTAFSSGAPPESALQTQSPSAAAAAAAREAGIFGDELRRILRGFAIAPVPLDLRGKNLLRVGLGSYLVNAVGGCNDCHTNPPYAEGGDPYLGEPKQINTEHYLAGGTDFGIAVSANITPDETGKPAGLDFDEFEEIIRTGIDDEDGHILQVMPWPVFQDQIGADLRAIYEYLSAIPHAEPGP